MSFVTHKYKDYSFEFFIFAFCKKEVEMQETENNSGLEYNTEREKLQMQEYGRNILKMVEQMRTIEDRAKRSEQAQAIVKVMELLNPQVHQQENYEQKLWDHLFMIAGFDLDIDAPYPIPSKETFETRPVPLPMKGDKVKAAHYGRNIEKIIALLSDEPDGEIKTAMIRSLAIYMRQQYLIWNKDSVADETIFADLEKLSDNKIKVPEGLELGGINMDSSYSRPGQGFSGNQNSQKNRNHRNRRKKK